MSLFKNISIAAALFATTYTYGQIVSQNFYSYRLDNMYNANPAFCAKGEGINFVLNAMSQNRGVSFANKNFMGGIYSKISPSQALGGRIVSDTRGAFQVFKADLTYAYILKINESATLNFGINAGALNTNLVTSRIENFYLLDQTDDMLYSPYFNTLQFTAGFGALLNWKALEVSIASPNLLSTNESAIAYLNGAIAYTFDAGDRFKVTPWINYQNIPVLKGVGGLYAKGLYEDKLWLQAGYQTNHAISVMAGFNWESFGLGYGFTFSNQAFSTITSGYHEVSVKYQLTKQKNNSNIGSTVLGDILKEMNRLASVDVTEENKEDLKEQLAKLKKELMAAEIDNSDPQEVKKVEKQLEEINEKLLIIEEKLK